MSDARSFWPALSQAEGVAVDRSVRDALVGSLRTVYAKAAGQISYDEKRLQILLDHIGRGPVRPAVVGLYTDLVESLLSNERHALNTVGQSLVEIDPAGDGTRIVCLSDEDLGAGQAERYARLVNDDPDRRYAIQPLGRGQADAFTRVSSALTLLDEGVPELALEIRGLVREIVLVTDAASQEAEPRSFDGASTFYLWGAVFLNVGDATRLDLAQAIAHEAAHLLLFGLMMGQPLTENDVAERYASPLRQDPRPMEGVVHAAYVLARMSYAVERLLEFGLLSTEEQKKARKDLVTNRNRFFDTLPVIRRHARFRSGGDVVFHGAVEYMSQADELRQVTA